MGLRRVGADIELKAPPEKFYNIWRKQSHHMPNISPTNFQAVEVHEGDWETHGSVKLWNYTCGGKTETFKEKIEYDDENKKATFVAVEGDVFNYYKTYKAIFQYLPKGRGTLAKLTLEYEKLGDDVPDAIHYLDFVVAFTKDMDAHLVKN